MLSGIRKRVFGLLTSMMFSELSITTFISLLKRIETRIIR